MKDAAWAPARILVAALALLAPGGCATSEAPRGDAGRPNILFLLTDDQRFDTLGCMGNPIIRTPHLDGIGSRGVVFTNAFVTTSLCALSRASILRGQYVSRHGIADFKKEFAPDELARTYPGVLKKAGYRMGFIGKWGVGNPPSGLFDYNAGFPGQGMFLDPKNPSRPHLNRHMGDQALEFLDGGGDGRPWCLSVSFKAPHHQDEWPDNQYPYEQELAPLYRDATIPPPPLSDPAFFESLPGFLRTSESRVRWARRFTPEKYQESVKAYYRLITGVDVAVGRILEKLRARGEEKNTVIVFTSDNGCYLGERGFADKWYPHEVSIRVPLLIYDPRAPAGARGTRRGEMALNVDLAPTVLDLAGVSIPESMQGRTLAPLVRGERPAWRSEFYYEHLYTPPESLRISIPQSEAVRTERWKYLRFVDVDPPREEMYDLAADPDEARNLIADARHADERERLKRLLDALRSRAK